jgi:hypothetical protein
MLEAAWLVECLLENALDFICFLFDGLGINRWIIVKVVRERLGTWGGR